MHTAQPVGQLRITQTPRARCLREEVCFHPEREHNRTDTSRRFCTLLRGRCSGTMLSFSIGSHLLHLLCTKSRGGGITGEGVLRVSFVEEV